MVKNSSHGSSKNRERGREESAGEQGSNKFRSADGNENVIRQIDEELSKRTFHG